MHNLFAYTDGACSGNPGPGGWGVLLVAKTNNQMELLAAISALEILDRPSKIKIITDSSYVKNGVTQWLENWKA